MATENLNAQLKIIPHLRTYVLDGHVVGFDGRRHCTGIIRRNGQPHPYDKPEPITHEILRDAKRQPLLFEVEEVEEKPAKSSASTRKAKAKKSEPIAAVEAVAETPPQPFAIEESAGEIPHISEVEDAKTVVEEVQ